MRVRGCVVFNNCVWCPHPTQTIEGEAKRMEREQRRLQDSLGKLSKVQEAEEVCLFFPSSFYFFCSFFFFFVFFFFWWVALIQIRLPPLCHMSMPAHAHNHTHKKYVPAFINTCEQAQKQEAKVLQTKRSTALARIEELGASLVTLETQISEHQRVCAALIYSCAFL